MSSQWDAHKERIEWLYLKEKKPLTEVMETIKNETGFSHSKSQYERQLHKWGFKKDMTQRQKIYLKAKLPIDAQKKGKIQIRIHGRLIDSTEVRRKERDAQRQKKSPLQRRSNRVNGVLWLKPSLSNTSWDTSGTVLIGDLDGLIDMPDSLVRDIVSTICQYVAWSSRLYLTAMGDMGRLHYFLRATTLARDERTVLRFLQKTFNNHRYATMELLKLSVYLLSNRILRPTATSNVTEEREVSNLLLVWFQLGENRRLLQAAVTGDTPTSREFAKRILISALKSEDELTTRILLESGLNPNYKSTDPIDFFFFLKGNVPPLHFMVHRGNLSLVQLLLKFKADPTTFHPLRFAALHGTDKHLEIADLLLSHNCTLDILRDDTLSYASTPSALQLAAIWGHTKFACFLLQKGADMNAAAGSYGPPLACAIEHGANDLAHLLLDRGADVNCDPGVEGFTALQSAAKVQNHAMVKKLLDHGAEADAPPARVQGESALCCAAGNGDLVLCKVLLQAGADVNGISTLRCCRVRAPVAAAVVSGNCQLVRFLLDQGADINYQLCLSTKTSSCLEREPTLLMRACEQRNMGMLELLLSYGASPCQPQDTSIVAAAKHQEFQMMRILLNAGADINAVDDDGLSALWVAVDSEDETMVQFLLDEGASPNLSISTMEYRLPLVAAAQKSTRKMAEILLSAGAELNAATEMFGSALQAAAAAGSVAMVEFLLAAGAKVDGCPQYPYTGTALQVAIEKRQMEVVWVLINAGANLNCPAKLKSWSILDGTADFVSQSNFNTSTALQAAIISRNVDLVSFLLRNGAQANDNPGSHLGLNSVQLAVQRGDTNLVQHLIQHGADVNCPAGHIRGLTALQTAAKRGNYDMVELLLKKGADINAPACDERGYTALQAAASRGYLRIARLLLNNGAVVNAPGSRLLGKTALEFAIEYGRVDMVKLLSGTS
ncbi:ankyrin repeat-containing domain protein [Xylariales sp. PMI_506]|nr:ankyrin repeat-containing domain protein [Xylariales sp. PMI_506]